MRKYLFALILGIGFIFSANAQNQVVKTNPLGLAFGNLNATYERVLSESSSLNISASYFYGFAGIDVNSIGVGAGWRYFFTHKKKPVPAGFYVQPQVALSFGSVTDDFDDEFNYSTFGVGAEIGYQWVWDSGFVLDLGIGPMYTTYTGDGADEFDANGILPSATLAIGYAFE